MPVLAPRTILRVILITLTSVFFAHHAIAQVASPYPVANPSFEGSYGALADCSNAGTSAAQ
jgi:hypothetical protein